MGNRWTRRDVIRRGLFGGAILALGAAAWRMTGEAPSVQLKETRHLSRDAETAFRAIARRVVGTAKGFPSIEDAKLVARADVLVGRIDEHTRGELDQVLSLFESRLASVAFLGPFQPFSALSPEAQDRVLDGWEHSRFTLKRTGYAAIRSLAVAAYYSAPSTWEAVGYSGPPEGFHQADAPVWRGGSEPRPVDDRDANDAESVSP